MKRFVKIVYGMAIENDLVAPEFMEVKSIAQDQKKTIRWSSAAPKK
jgi:hypothetical protein